MGKRDLELGEDQNGNSDYCLTEAPDRKYGNMEMEEGVSMYLGDT